MVNRISSNKRIAKNTIFLYARTFIVMILSLYTSRVVLKALGVEDYGIYQVVGGMVAMFSVISNTLSGAVSRFITFEIGRGNKKKLLDIFATSRVVQLIIAFIVLLVGEIVGRWFICTQMQIPDNRIGVAQLVFHFSLISFCINLISVPYNACIIAHEHMKAFAYISIIEALLKIVICYLLLISPIDRLATYGFFMMMVAVGMRVIYIVYCRKNFEESKCRLFFSKKDFWVMLNFAGWSFFTNTSHLFNTQGVNMLINIFFGVTFNAARGIANQVEGAIVSFVSSFTTALSPQITKSYAVNAKNDMHKLVCRGAKYSFFLMYIMALPVICETSTILSLWLTIVPEKTIQFVQLSLVLGLIDCIGRTGVTACLATGELKKYSLIITPLAMLQFPLVWIAYYMGASIEFAYYTYILVRISVLIARMLLMKGMLDLPVIYYIENVFIPIVLVAVVAVIPSILIIKILPPTLFRLVVSVVVGMSTVLISSFVFGMSISERNVIINKIKVFYYKIKV